jgi:hypothetical protein
MVSAFVKGSLFQVHVAAVVFGTEDYGATKTAIKAVDRLIRLAGLLMRERVNLTCKNMIHNNSVKERELTATETHLIHFGGSCFHAWNTQLTPLKSQNINHVRLRQPSPIVGVL